MPAAPSHPPLSSSKYTHFTGEETGPQGGHTTCPGPLSQTMTLGLSSLELMPCPPVPAASGTLCATLLLQSQFSGPGGQALLTIMDHLLGGERLKGIGET